MDAFFFFFFFFPIFLDVGLLARFTTNVSPFFFSPTIVKGVIGYMGLRIISYQKSDHKQVFNILIKVYLTVEKIIPTSPHFK